MATYEITMRVRVDDGLAFHNGQNQQDLCDNASEFCARRFPGGDVDVVARWVYDKPRGTPLVKLLPVVKNERATLRLLSRTPW